MAVADLLIDRRTAQVLLDPALLLKLQPYLDRNASGVSAADVAEALGPHTAERLCRYEAACSRPNSSPTAMVNVAVLLRRIPADSAHMQEALSHLPLLRRLTSDGAEGRRRADQMFDVAEREWSDLLGGPASQREKYRRFRLRFRNDKVAHLEVAAIEQWPDPMLWSS